MRAARRPRLVGGLAQLAPGREHQERLDRGARQGDDVLPVEPAFARRRRRRGAGEIGQPVELVRGEHQPPLVLVMQHVLAEQRVQARQPLGDRRHARLPLRGEPRAAAHEAQMMALQQPPLIGRQGERVALRVERVDAGEQAGIERDLACDARRASARSRDRSPAMPGWSRWHRGCGTRGRRAAAAGRCAPRPRSCWRSRAARQRRRSRRSRPLPPPCRDRRPAGNAPAGCARTAAIRTASSRCRRTGCRSWPANRGVYAVRLLRCRGRRNDNVSVIASPRVRPPAGPRINSAKQSRSDQPAGPKATPAPRRRRTCSPRRSRPRAAMGRELR